MPDQALEGTAVAMSEIQSGTYSGYDDPQQIVITTQEEWAKTWEKINQHKSPAPEMPKVDFNTQSVVAVFLGMKGSGGFGIRIAETKMSGEILNVKVVQSKPGQDCMTTSALTQPYHLIVVDKAAIQEAAFSVEEKINDCE